MIPASFDYVAPASLGEAITLLQQHNGEAKLLAGGHSLIPVMKLRLSEPGVLIDLGNLIELRGISRENGSVVIGALTTHAAAGSAPELAGIHVLGETARSIGDVQVRNRGTLGGSVAHADPAADWPAAMLALDAEFVVQGPSGERTVPATDFFAGFFTTDLGDDEVLTQIRIAQPAGRTGSAYAKFPNPASGYAIVGVAAVLTLNPDGTVADARIGITGAGDHAVRATTVEDALRGKQLTDDLIAEAAARVMDGIDAMDDIHASAEYRAELARVYTRRALTQARDRAQI